MPVNRNPTLGRAFPDAGRHGARRRFERDDLRCRAFVTRIGVERHEDTAQFERELRETRPLSPKLDAAIPLRMVL